MWSPVRSARGRSPAAPAVLIALAGCASPPQESTPDDDATAADDDTTAGPVVLSGRAVDRVDPFVGTGGLGFGVGAAYPGPSTPFGMAKPGPDTSDDFGAPGFAHCSGYWYEDPYIDGFSQIRLHGTGVPGYGNFLLVPTDGMAPDRTDREGYRQSYSHETEEARPGYYAVTLDDTGIRAELTATDRAAHHRYTFPGGAPATVILDVAKALGENACSASDVWIDASTGVVEGHAVNQGGLTSGQPVSFSLRVDPLPAAVGTWVDGVLAEGATSAAGAGSLGAWLDFALPADGGAVEVQVGVSLRGVAAARANREAEMPGWDFDGVVAATEARWEEALRAVEVEGGTADEQVMLYTALYHSLLMPDLVSDADGRYVGFDGQEHDAGDTPFYSDMSLWDTYRTLHPLLNWIAPDRQRDFAVSLVRMYEQGGAFPRWPAGSRDSGSMVGESADIVLAEAWIKGVRDWDVETAWEGLTLTADGPLPDGVTYGGRAGIEGYLERGWCAADEIGGATSVTLEYAWDDYALSRLADALDKQDDAARYLARSRGWRGLYRADTRFLEGRYADGTWAERGNDTTWDEWYVEANAWQTVFAASFDGAAYADLMGGQEAFADRLSELFALSAAADDTIAPDAYYWHGNEPDLHYPYLFIDAGRPDLARQWVRWVLRGKYGTGADGLDGNDDGGTLSAWYVFTALGIYPLAGTDRYWLGTPLFPRAVVHLPGGDLTIEAEGAAADRHAVDAVTLDGEPVEDARLTHDQIAAGATLRFDLSGAP